MKATLLIKNIASLYTCNETNAILHDAFIAIHHDRIIDLGEHDWKKWLDEATRIIDARGECVIPAYIEPALKLDASPFDYSEYRDSQVLYNMLSNGILTVACSSSYLQRKTLQQDVITRKRPKQVIDSLTGYVESGQPEEFILSCGYDQVCRHVYSMHQTAFELFNTCHVSQKNILEAMTANPARALGLKERGKLEKGFQADLLILHAPDYEVCLQTSGINLIRHMVKRGIPVYPILIRA